MYYKCTAIIEIQVKKKNKNKNKVRKDTLKKTMVSRQYFLKLYQISSF